MIAVGKKPLELTLKNQDDQTVSLADYADQWVVLCFYPRDDTPGCMKEAFEFTKEIAAFRKLGPLVLGCSSGSRHLHRAFISQHQPRVALLSDPTHKTMERHEAWGEKNLYAARRLGSVGRPC